MGFRSTGYITLAPIPDETTAAQVAALLAEDGWSPDGQADRAVTAADINRSTHTRLEQRHTATLLDELVGVSAPTETFMVLARLVAYAAYTEPTFTDDEILDLGQWIINVADGRPLRWDANAGSELVRYTDVTYLIDLLRQVGSVDELRDLTDRIYRASGAEAIDTWRQEQGIDLDGQPVMFE